MLCSRNLSECQFVLGYQSVKFWLWLHCVNQNTGAVKEQHKGWRSGWLVEHLLCKQKGLSHSPRTYGKGHVRGHRCQIPVQEESRGLLKPGANWLVRDGPKKQLESTWEMTHKVILWPQYVQVHTQEHASTHTKVLTVCPSYAYSMFLEQTWTLCLHSDPIPNVSCFIYTNVPKSESYTAKALVTPGISDKGLSLQGS